MWSARVADVMNPMGSLAVNPLRNSTSVHFHSSQRDALFLAAWKRAIDPTCSIQLNFNAQVALQNSLHTMLQLAAAVIENTTRPSAEARIGSLRRSSARSEHCALPSEKEAAELRLREEALYFFGTLAGLATNSGISEKVKSFEYLATVVGQRDELLPMIVGEQLGDSLRKSFEYLCALHYFQSNCRQSGRLAKLYRLETELQERCRLNSVFAERAMQPATLHFSADVAQKKKCSEPAVVFLPSAFRAEDSSARHKLFTLVGNYLTCEVREFYFVDSFHQRLRWMERLSRVRQAECREALRREPLRAQAIMDSRSGRQQIAILSPETLSFLELFVQSRTFASLPFALQEIVHTALELDSIRQREGWGLPVSFDFILLCETLASASRSVHSDRLLHSLSDVALLKFFDTTLRRQEFDNRLCDRLLQQ